MNEELSEELANYFLVKDYKWKFEYGHANPDEDDMQRALNRVKEILDEQEDNTQLEMGHLLFKKRAGVIDVFVHAGTIGETSEDSDV
ncbi:hypothetical protein SEA_TUNATARTARE_197 [Streptomyces phage TunaTartare]|jgi:hypothetical protein|uniref:Uncharacterized protein n=1 Tax=Streptomyces phage TunaTartare TaxID=2848887 RepID=A0A8F2IW85_9CAUD|nr:hypothetical protein PP457_gp083 [Streptomyces phage TunaTartare]QWT30059.1 hypothetical protein SEA_TUNATARTARE_197 [Streptomyces phage TunaTartare]